MIASGYYYSSLSMCPNEFIASADIENVSMQKKKQPMANIISLLLLLLLLMLLLFVYTVVISRRIRVHVLDTHYTHNWAILYCTSLQPTICALDGGNALQQPARIIHHILCIRNNLYGSECCALGENCIILYIYILYTYIIINTILV